MTVTLDIRAIENFRTGMDRAAREGFESLRRAYAEMLRPAADFAERFKLQAPRPLLPSFAVEMPKMARLFALPDWQPTAADAPMPLTVGQS